MISSAGALVKYKETYIYKAEFSTEETKELIKMARETCGNECEITIDTVDEHYWNYKIDLKQQDKSWVDSIYTDFTEFEMPSLKMCVEIFDENAAKMLQEKLPECDCVLVRTRMIVLRAANKLSDDMDMSVVEKESYAYYKRALENGEHIAYLVYDNGSGEKKKIIELLDKLVG